MESEVFTVKELSEILNIGRKQAYELVNDRKIHSIRIGSTIRIPKWSVDKYLGITNGEVQIKDRTHEQQIGLLT